MKTQKSCTCFARKATKPLPCLHFTFIQQTLFKLLILRLAESPPIPLLLPLASCLVSTSNLNARAAYQSTGVIRDHEN